MAKIIFQCKNCKDSFSVIPSRKNAKCCSMNCRNKIISLSLIGNKRSINRIPWNKGKKWSSSIKKKISNSLKGNIPWDKGLKNPFGSEENHPYWKGNNIGYTGLHAWVTSHLGKPDTCQHCGKSNLSKHQIHWANKSHEYKRELADWIRLCVRCHGIYDRNYRKLERKRINLIKNYGEIFAV